MRIDRTVFLTLALGGAGQNLVACASAPVQRAPEVDTSALEEAGAIEEDLPESYEGVGLGERGPVCDVWAEDGSCEEYLPMQECVAWDEDGACAAYESDATEE
jgi:hypothetical protein